MSNLQFLFVDDQGDYTDSYVDGLGELRPCSTGANVGDLVMNSETVPNGVDVATDNLDMRDIIGIIVEKPDTDEAVVMTKGRISGLSGLTKSKKVFMGVDGSISADMPLYGNMVILGHSVDADSMDFYPVNTKVSKAPQGHDTEEQAEANPVDLDTSSLASIGDSMEETYYLG